MANTDIRTEAKWDNIKAVMGWDIGDEYSVAFIKFIVGGDNVSKPLYLNKYRDVQVEKSAVAKNSSGIITIGENATKQQEVAINFKQAPKNWDHKYVMGLTYRQHMSNYIRGVSEAILQNSSNRNTLRNIITKDDRGNLHWKKDAVLLTVGCPASVIWKGEKMRRQYEELISEATGISNVIVTEESRAAVFSLFEKSNVSEKINLQTGVLVLDFGSSTADATFILPGKKSVNIRWTLGAAQVENAMLEYILQSSKTKKMIANLAKIYGKKKILVARTDCTHAIFQLRLYKEDYFDGNLGEDAVRNNVSIPIMDEDGDPIFDEDGEPSVLTIPYYVTVEMMRYALDEYEFNVQKNDMTVNYGTWKESCRQFLNDVKLTLERENFPVQTVVVTGDGSRIPLVVELSSKAFQRKVILSDMPLYSVAKGLVTTAYFEVKATEAHGKAMKDINSDAAVNINAMLDIVASNLANKAYDAAVSAVDCLTWYDDSWLDKIRILDGSETNVGEIIRAVKNAISSSLENNARTQIDDSTKTWIDKDNEVIVRHVNGASQQIYADHAMKDMVWISQADIQAIRNSVSSPNISVPDAAKDTDFIGKIGGCIFSTVFFVVITTLATTVPVLAPFFIQWSIPGVIDEIMFEIMIDKMRKQLDSCPVTRGAILGAVRKMKEDKNEKMKEIKQPLNQALREVFTKPDAYGKDFEKHYTVLMETAEMAFKKILLKTGDEQ